MVLSRSTKVLASGVQAKGCDHWAVFESCFWAEIRFALVLLEYVRDQMVVVICTTGGRVRVAMVRQGFGSILPR